MIFLSFDEIKAILDLEKTEADYPIIPVIESGVISAIESFTKRKLTYGNYVEKDYGSDLTTLFALKALPIATINSVAIDGVAVDQDNYIVNTFGLDFYRPYPKLFIEIDYDGGFKKITDTGPSFATIDSLDSEIYRALFLQTIYEYQSRDYIGSSTVTNEGGSITKPGLKLLDEVVRLLKGHKHIINCGI